MILGINSSGPILELHLDDQVRTLETGRDLARDLLGILQRELAARNANFTDITGIVVFRGPGSFTGLRIGATVANTIAHDMDINIVGATGDDWYQTGQARLAANETDQVILPFYDRPANITPPRH
jgi:tRNA threonylcarbamoyladenosine biosynthesis protein TsaB